VQLPDAPVGAAIASYSAGLAGLKGRFSKLISDLEKKAIEARIAEFVHSGVPFDLAEDIAVLPLLSAVPEVIMLSENQRVSAWDAARVYFAAGAVIGLDRLRALAGRISTADHWDRLALRRIVDDLYAAQRMISAEALSAGGSGSVTAVEIWRNRRRDDVERMLNFVAELERSGDPSISKLALANSQIQKLAAPAAVTQMR
jgi:glutamate dehydrogenase